MPRRSVSCRRRRAAGKIVAAICHGPWVLSDAGLTRGKRATGWWSIKPDLENAGATFNDEPAITDGKIVTARAPIDLAAFVHAIDDLLVARNAQKRSGLHFGYTTVTHS